jgi:hypothetical protein
MRLTAALARHSTSTGNAVAIRPAQIPYAGLSEFRDLLNHIALILA